MAKISKVLFVLPFVIFLGEEVLVAQIKDVGLPFITNYPREQYGAGTQNWGIAQDQHGFMYFANNNGVLRYDGNAWKIFPLPNQSLVRSVACFDNKIFAGGYDEFGYFSYNGVGEMVYTSLSAKFDSSSIGIGEVWRIHSTQSGIAFQSYNGILLYANDSLIKIKPKSRFGFSYSVDNKLYVVDRQNGLYTLNNNRLEPFYVNSRFFVNNEIKFIFPAAGNQLLLGTANRGIYELAQNRLRAWGTPINQEFIKNQLYTAVSLGQGTLAIGTVQNGLYIIKTDGTLIQQINRFKGLQNNTVLSLYYDKRKNLWLGLDNGIDYLETSSPFSILNYCYNLETTYATIVSNGILYVGTNQGLFAIQMSQLSNKHGNPEFSLVEGTQGQVWTLKKIEGRLICGHNYGTFLIEGFQSKVISDIPGGWDYEPVPSFPGLIVGGTYTGLALFQCVGKNGLNFLGKISGFKESCLDIAFGTKGELWMTHGYKGLYKLILSQDYQNVEQVTLYNNTKGLPKLPYSLAPLKGQLNVVADNEIYSYDNQTDSFKVSTKYRSLLSDITDLVKIEEDSWGDIWFYSSQKLGVYRLLEDGSYSEITIPFNRIHNQFFSGTFANIYAYDRSHIFIGGLKGMLHYSPNNKEYKNTYPAYIKGVKVGKTASGQVLKEYFFKEPEKGPSKVYKFPFKQNDISIGYITPGYEAPGQVQFSRRLLGFNNTWSAWDLRTRSDYTNLSGGDYIFEVKAKDVYGNQSEIARFNFTVKPPFYKTNLAYFIYTVLLLLIIVVNAFYFKRRIEKTRQAEKLKHKKELVQKEQKYRQEALLSEQEIERLKNEKLMVEMRHKDMELANSTMNMIQKNKFLNEVKDEIHALISKLSIESNKYALRQIVKRIDKDIKNKQYWKVFDKYFDEVHQDFTKRLKERHPELTPKDLRLCAYLKMNLSTKEIAPLMNISVRGVEISRYRLRKKLGLERDVNLIEYILTI